MSTTSRLNSQTGQGSSTPRSQTTTVTNDGAGLLSKIANALGMPPPTVKEIRLGRENHELKEKNKLFRAEYDILQTAARKYHHDAFLFHHDNLRLQESLEALSLEAKGIRVKHEEAKSLVETRLKRLLAAQVFVTSEADSQSMSELIQRVESLNDDTAASNNAADSDAEARIQDGADPLPTISTPTTWRLQGSNNKTDHDTATSVNDKNATNLGTSEVQTFLPEDLDENSRNRSDSEATSTNAVPQGGTASVLLGGFAGALGLPPPTARETRLEKDNYKLKEENKLLLSEYSNLDAAARKYHHDASRFHHDNQRLTETLEATSLEVKGMAERYEETKSLAETHGKMLLEAQVLLTKADRISILELIQRVEGLNDEIYQAAASLGESIVQRHIEPSEQPHCSSEESAIAKALLGSPLCKVLRSSAKKIDSEGINPLLVQIALQTFFSMFCIQRIRSWVPSQLAFDTTLRELYEKIWSSSE